MKSPFSSAFFALLARKLETRFQSTGEIREWVIAMKLTGHMSEPGEEQWAQQSSGHKFQTLEIQMSADVLCNTIWQAHCFHPPSTYLN